MISGEGFQTIGAICGVIALVWRLSDLRRFSLKRIASRSMQALARVSRHD